MAEQQSERERFEADEAKLIEKAALHVGMKSLMNHGAASCVYSEGCNGVTQDHLIAFAREIALHCAAALSHPSTQGWLPIPMAPKDWGATTFDVWARGERVADCWWGTATYDGHRPKRTGIVYRSDYDSNGPVDSFVEGATHWMPPPPPPEQGGKG